MKLKAKIQRDKQALSQLDRNGKLLFLWDYYKIPILSVLCVLVLVLLTVLTSASSGKAAMYAVFVNTASAEGDREALDEILEQGGIALSGRHVDVTADLHLGREHDELSDAQTVQVLAALFGIKGLDFFAADEAVFEKYAQQDAFLNLALFLDADTLSRHREDLYYYENADGQTVLGGIRLHPGSPLHEAGYFLTEVTVGIAASAQNMEEALCFLKQLL